MKNLTNNQKQSILIVSIIVLEVILFALMCINNNAFYFFGINIFVLVPSSVTMGDKIELWLNNSSK